MLSTSILRQSVSTLVIVLPLIQVPLSFCSPARLPYRMITRRFLHNVSPTLVLFSCCCCCKFVTRTFLGIPHKNSRSVCIHVESIPSTRGPAMMSVPPSSTIFIIFFHIGLRFCFLPVILVASHVYRQEQSVPIEQTDILQVGTLLHPRPTFIS